MFGVTEPRLGARDLLETACPVDDAASAAGVGRRRAAWKAALDGEAVEARASRTPASGATLAGLGTVCR